MRTAREIYEHYEVPPWLQRHQLLVAAVGKLTADRMTRPVHRDLVVRTCLLHDIGAIVKFDFTVTAFRAVCPLEDIPHWVDVQQRMRDRYGEREYVATEKILQELGCNDVREVFSNMGLANISSILKKGLIEAQVAQYGDLRVGPHGIVSIPERLADLVKRYAAYWQREGRSEESKHYPRLTAELERTLFIGSQSRPDEISDAAAAPLIEELWDYEIA
jgi:hypothetical protein